MFKINDYVYHKNNFGLGIVVAILDDAYEVEFLDYGRKRIIRTNNTNHQYLEKLDPLMVSYILTEDYSNNYFLLEKGREYFKFDRVEILSYGSNRIKSIVSGTYDYEVELEFKNRRLSNFYCSCPVKGLCKHSVATLFQAQSELLKLNNNKNNKIDLGIIEILDINFNYDYSSFREYYKAFNDFKTNYKDKLYSYLYTIEKKYDGNMKLLEFILSIPMLYDETTEYVSYYCEKVTASNTVKNVYLHIKKDISYEEQHKNAWYKKPSVTTYRNYIVNEDYEELMSDISGNYYKKLVIFLVEEDIPKKYDLLNEFTDIFYKNKIFDFALQYLADNLPSDSFNSLLDYLDVDSMSVEVLVKIFDVNKLLDIASGSSNKKLIEYICDHYDEFINVDKKKTIQTLIYHQHLYSNVLNAKVKKTLENEMTPYLYLYFCNQFYKLQEEDNIDINALNRHFTFNYSIRESNNDICIGKYLLVCNLYLISVTEYVYSKEIYSDNISKRNLSKINNMFDEALNSIYGDEYQNKINNLKEEVKVKRQKLFDERFKQNIDSLNRYLGPEPIMLTDERLMDVEFSFFEGYDCYNLTYRVGKEKKYVVKDVFDFARSVFNNGYVEYGKSLAFYHHIDNFNPIYKEPLLYALEILNSDSKGKEQKLQSYYFSKLLFKLKGLKINYNNNEYYVRLNKLDYKVKLDKDYVLSDGYDKDGVVPLYDHSFYFNKEDGMVDILTSNKSDTSFVSFINTYKGDSIKNNSAYFKQHIYERFNHLVEVDEELKEEFKIKDILIKAHFDYDGKIISVKTVLCDEEGNEIKENDIESSLYIKYNKYLNYLTNLGFVDNELKDQNKILHFFSMDFTNLKKLCSVYLSDSIANKKLEVFNKHTVIINNHSSIMEAFVEESCYTDEELYEILKALKLKKKFVLLKGDRIIRLDNSEAEEFYDAVNTLKLDKKSVLKPKNIPVYQSIKAHASLNNVKLDEYLSNMISEISDFKNYNIGIPILNSELREYQIEGFKWLSILTKYHLGGILADDMGLGKTIQMIALLKAHQINKPTLIVCPKTLIFNWKSEFQKFDDTREVVEVYGISNIREHIIKNIDYNSNTVYITSYDSLRNDEKLYKKEFGFLILDEAQVIKNVYAGKSIAVKSVKAIHRFALTGTPVENNIIDLWSIFDFIMPEYFEELTEFKSLYTNDENFVNKVSKRIAPFILRRTKEAVLHDLPSKYERIITVQMKEEQRKIYDSYKLEAQSILSSGGGSFDVFPYLMKLRQICIDPSMFTENYYELSAKMDELYDIIPEYIANGHRILIFSQFVKALDIVKEFLTRNNIKHFYLTGDTKAKDRINYTNEFNANENIKVFLISLKAGGTGLNLIGADTVVHLDPWWNQAAELQATDRTHRIGQTRNVEVIKLICEDSIEKRVIELQNLKKDLIDKLISNDDSSITKLTLDDLKFILKE